MRSLVLLTVLAGCATSPNEGRYVGPVTPTVSSELCRMSRGVFTARNGAVSFSPDEGIWTLSGSVAPDGTVEAGRARVAGGASRTSFETKFFGKLTLAEVTGTYTTPRCTYAVLLKRI